MENHNGRNEHRRGFTLLEVLIAVVLLATSLTIALGMQSAELSAAHSISKTTLATGAARRFLAVVERSGDDIEIGTKEGSLQEVYQQIGSSMNDSWNDPQTGWFHTLFTVEPWSFQGLPDQSAKKATLTLSWGSSAQDTMSIVLLVPNLPEENF